MSALTSNGGRHEGHFGSTHNDGPDERAIAPFFVHSGLFFDIMQGKPPRHKKGHFYRPDRLCQGFDRGLEP